MTTSVILVDDHELIRQGLRRAFERDETFDVVGEAGTGEEARRLVDTLHPDVAIVDIRLPDVNGLELAKELRAKAEQMGIVVLTMYSGDEHLFGALEAGASAFVLKSAPADEVAAAVRQAATSPTAFTANDLAGAMRRRMTAVTVQLTPREHEILQLLGEGMSVAQVATKLFISQSTAKTHMSKLYEKLDASNRTQAVMAAVRLGLLSTEAARG